MDKIGIGLPIGDPASLLEWARRAEQGPFSTLGLLDRLVYDNPEPLVALAAVAGATSRIKVQTEVLLAPLRQTELLAKQAATLDRISGGRFVLGLGVGGRADDHAAAGYPLGSRGARMDEQLERLRAIWSGKAVSETAGPIGPAPHRPGGPEILFGAFSPKALARVAAWGDGFLAAAPPAWIGGLIDTVRAQWAEAGREGSPRIVAQANAALGSEECVDQARATMRDYYSFTGDRADQMVAGMLTSGGQIRDAIVQYRDLGVDEVMFYCYGEDPEQVDRLAEVL